MEEKGVSVLTCDERWSTGEQQQDMRTEREKTVRAGLLQNTGFIQIVNLNKAFIKVSSVWH